MTQKNIIKVGDRYYDSLTGLPVEQKGELAKDTSASLVRTVSHANQLHTSTSRSKTLHRASVTRPPQATATKADQLQNPVTKKVAQPIQKSSHISRFAPSIDGVRPKTTADVKPAVKQQQVQTQTPAPVEHKVVTKQPKTAAQIKHTAIESALQTANSSSHKQHKAPTKKSSRIIGFASAGLAVLLLAGYVSYLTMPSISLRVAAAQAGLDASYPQYHPDGYRPGGAITFAPGQVNIPFSANGSDLAYTVTQTKSSWDSSAVKEYVEEETNGAYAYSTETERGLTIYTYSGNAAWVNGGVLYTISGDANLSTDQIRRIATSL